MIYKLDSCKNTSRTLVKVLLNLLHNIFYTCSATPVITSRTLVTWTCNGLLNSFSSPLVNTMVRLVNYKCESFIKLTPKLNAELTTVGKQTLKPRPTATKNALAGQYLLALPEIGL